MNQRIWTLTTYLIGRLSGSLAGAFYLAAAAAFYGFAFRTRTPEPDYFILVIALFGGAVTFFSTLTIASRANEGKSAPFFVRLDSRIEYLVAVLSAALLFSLTLQTVLAIVVYLFNDPILTIGQLSEIPPVWVSTNVLLSLLALHATDFVARGWSRVWLFGGIAFLLVLGDYYDWFVEQVADFLRTTARSVSNPESVQDLHSAANWLSGLDNSWAESVSNIVSWPIESTVDAIMQGYFTTGQAFAPAVMLIYATALFLIASDLFARKDLFLTED